MSQGKRKRSRGLVFTSQGWQKLQTKKQVWENNYRDGKRCTLEDLSEITGLSYNTVLKIQERQQGVDKRSLVKFSLAFDLELSSYDYISPSYLKQSISKQTAERVNWDEPIELSSFCGRDAELALLEQWLVKDRCRLVTVQGIVGIGKTTLCAKLIEQVQHEFEFVIWRSLKGISSLKELLMELLRVLIERPQITNASKSNVSSCIQQLLSHLRSCKCLIALDCLDTTMLSGELCGTYSPECQDYNHFIKYLGETVHQSCLLLITREKPKEVTLIEGAQKILVALELLGTETEQNRLIEKNDGHPLALKIAAQKIHNACNGSIAQFLQQEEIMLEELHQLWSQCIERLSSIEREVICKLASYDEPASFSRLRQKLPSSISSHKIIDSLESLLGRSLIVKKSGAFSVYHQLLIQINL